MTQWYCALVNRCTHAVLERLNITTTVYLYIFLGLSESRRYVVTTLHFERDGIILKFLNSALAHQVVVQRLQLGLIIRIITDLVQLNHATRILLYLNFSLLSMNIIAHLLHTRRSLIQLLLRGQHLSVAYLTGLFAGALLSHVQLINGSIHIVH